MLFTTDPRASDSHIAAHPRQPRQDDGVHRECDVEEVDISRADERPDWDYRGHVGEDVLELTVHVHLPREVLVLLDIV